MTPNGSINGDNSSGNPDKRLVMFFDIDNCLYSKNHNIHKIMGDLIDDYFQNHLSMDRADATALHLSYYKDYGLAIEGLVRHHKIDPLEYNRKVDDALPLDDIIKPDPELRILLESIDRSKVKMWLFTNAYITHGQRVIKLLGIQNLFEGITYCDYGAPDGRLLCKPDPKMFGKAMQEAGLGISDVNMASKEVLDRCYFVDDSAINAAGAKKLGWKTAHLVEPEISTAPDVPVADHQIGSLWELRDIFPELFTSRG